VIDPGASATQRVFADADILGDLISGSEADPINVLGQDVGIVPDQLDGPVAIGLVGPVAIYVLAINTSPLSV
jgi:hypothetical protein